MHRLSPSLLLALDVLCQLNKTERIVISENKVEVKNVFITGCLLTIEPPKIVVDFPTHYKPERKSNSKRKRDPNRWRR